ncbi:MAG: hypothetical protein LIP77_04085 [Planctomycetes bacterium]|nr:hypothetical protein [Planctomycetota bacterium]
MATQRRTRASFRISARQKSLSYTALLVGSVVFMIGLVLGWPWLAGLGFLPMVVSVVYLHSMLWSRYLTGTTFRKFLRDRGLSGKWFNRPE